MDKSRYLIFGAQGFIGQNLTKYLTDCGEIVFTADRFWEGSKQFFLDCHPTHVMNVAGHNGGILFQSNRDIFIRNCQINQSILDFCANQLKPKKVISLIASCAYPNSIFSLEESELLAREPHPSVIQHGYAKRHLFLLSKFYSNDTTKFLSVCPPTVFGESDLFNQNSKLVGAIISKLWRNQSEFLGTGREFRQLLYVGDLCRILTEVIKTYGDTDNVLNIPSPHNIRVSDLIAKLQKLLEREYPVTFSGDHAGVAQKVITSSRFKQYCPDFQFEDLNTSLRKTVEWFLDSVAEKINV